MRATIDGAGRIVIPKAVREAAGLQAGAEVDVRFRDGYIEIEPTARSMRVVKRKGRGLIEAEGVMPVLTAADVRDVLERARR